MLALRSLPVLFVDCQSTGATPAHGSLLELGWAVGTGAPTAHLTALPPGAEISRQVRRITGLDADAMKHARSPEQVWRELLVRALATTAEAGGGDGAAAPDDAASGAAQAGRSAPTVIHFATFEEKWLRDLHERFWGTTRLPVRHHLHSRHRAPAPPRPSPSRPPCPRRLLREQCRPSAAEQRTRRGDPAGVAGDDR